MGQEKLFNAMLTYTTDAMKAVEAIPGSVHEALTTDKAKVEAAREAIKKITDILKTEFVLAVSLDVPEEAAGDND